MPTRTMAGMAFQIISEANDIFKGFKIKWCIVALLVVFVIILISYYILAF